MDLLDYIAIFKSLQHIISVLMENSINEEFRESILPVINNLVSDTLEILTLCKRNNYNISEHDRWDVQHKLHFHQKQLDELVESLSILKECSKCKREFPATTRYFYTDLRARAGLRPECKKCHSNAKKEFYNKNKSFLK